MNDFHWIYKSGDGFAIVGRRHNQAYPMLMRTDAFGDAGCNNDTTLVTYLPNNITLSVDSFVVTAQSSPTIQTPVPVVIDTLLTGFVCGGVNVYEEKRNNMLVYPNPTRGNFEVQANSDIKEIVVYDFTGKEIIRTSKQSIDLSDSDSGIYIVQLRLTDGNQYISKVIVR